MPALFVFLLKVNISLVLFCLGYYLVLRHLTFYTLNRIYLVTAILFSTLYPQINLSDFAQRHQQLTGPVRSVILNWQAPAESLVKPLYQPNYWVWVEVIFWAGVILFAARLVMQLFSLYKLYKNSRAGNIQNYTVRLIRDDISPFSFWRSIYINPASLSPADLKNVLEHEQVHVNEWHTVDILLAELSTIFYWFNPGVWLMKKAVRENIEFITDRKILQRGTDSKQYQYSLVSVSLATMPNTLVNHFNISTIKKRIIMMNTKRSPAYKLTRYVFLPAVIALLLVFSLSKADISKAGLHTIKSFDSAISIVKGINATTSITAPVKEVTGKSAYKNKITKTADTLYSGKSKNGNKSFMMTSDQKADSINYVLNGVKSSKAEVQALDPARMQSLELVTAKDAKKFFPQLDNDRQVLFVTTDDSEAGKRLKEKMDKSFINGTLGKITNIAVGSSSGGLSIAPMASGSGVSIARADSSDDVPMAISSENGNVSTAVTVVTAPRVRVNATVSLKSVYVTTAPKATIVLKQDYADEQPVIAFDTLQKVYAYKAASKIKPYKLTLVAEPRISDVSDKLIIIDGKQATEKDLKALRITNIKSMTEKTDHTTKEKYGDKAKNGVLFITTKK